MTQYAYSGSGSYPPKQIEPKFWERLCTVMKNHGIILNGYFDQNIHHVHKIKFKPKSDKFLVLLFAVTCRISFKKICFASSMMASFELIILERKHNEVQALFNRLITTHFNRLKKSSSLLDTFFSSIQSPFEYVDINSKQ